MSEIHFSYSPRDGRHFAIQVATLSLARQKKNPIGLPRQLKKLNGNERQKTKPVAKWVLLRSSSKCGKNWNVRQQETFWALIDFPNWFPPQRHPGRGIWNSKMLSLPICPIPVLNKIRYWCIDRCLSEVVHVSLGVAFSTFKFLA